MPFNHAKHFWTWFSANAELYRHLRQMDKKQQQFWEREIVTHLRAYTKKLSASLFLPREGEAALIITALGDQRYFRMAEMMAEKAPAIKNWKVYGLQPPKLFAAHLEKKFATTGITRAGIQCLPPIWKPDANRYVVRCYANTGEDPDVTTIEAVDAMVSDQLGEWIIGQYVEWIEMYDRSQLTDQQYGQLIPLDQLNGCFPDTATSNLSINSLGELKETK